MAEDFLYSVDRGVAILDWSVSDRSVNLLDEEGFQSLESGISRAKTDDAVRGIVITSTREDFGGGLDVAYLGKLVAQSDAGRLFALASRIHSIFRGIETCGKPVAAALPGTTAGGAMELALACHHRFAAANPAARFGLPEIRIGLFAGAGGTTRLVRMIGLERAGPLLLQGSMLPCEAAREAGLIDEVVPLGELRERAVDWVASASPEDARQPWDRPGYRIPGGGPYTPKGFPIFVGAAAMAGRRSGGNYPAIEAMLAVAYEGALVPFDAALRIEARRISKVLLDPRVGAMMRTNFLSKRALERGARRPAETQPQSISRIGVVGAGMMGAGIAFAAAKAGMDVVLLDRDEDGLARGMASIERKIASSLKRRRGDDGATVRSRISPGTEHESLAGCELVIEAVFEDPAVKAQTLARIASVVGEDAIVATNTSTLPVSELARAVPGTGRFVGIHFFSPVERMALVEIIRGRDTSDAAVGRALDLVSRIGKTPIVVRDARFFYTNRCIVPYTLEAAGMVAEGVNPARIENAALAAGMPLGCLQLIDETSLELGYHILVATRTALGAAYRPGSGDEVFERMVMEEGRKGRKSGAGFYDYENGRRTRLWQGLSRLWPPTDDQPTLAELKTRLLAIQAIEAVRALEQGVLGDIREGDVGAVLGWGFAPWSGGPFGWFDLLGPQRAITMCERLADAHGARFTPPDTLRRMAAEGSRFYGDSGGRAESA